MVYGRVEGLRLLLPAGAGPVRACQIYISVL